MYNIGEEIIDSSTKEQYKIIDLLYYEDDYSHEEQIKYVLENVNTKEKIEIDTDSKFINEYSPWCHYYTIEKYKEHEIWFQKILSKTFDF